MYGWNDPIDQEGAQRPLPPTGRPPRRSSGRTSPTDRNDYQSYGAAAYASLPGPTEPDQYPRTSTDGSAVGPAGAYADHPPYRRPGAEHYRHETDDHWYGPTDGDRYRYGTDSDGYRYGPTDGDEYRVGPAHRPEPTGWAATETPPADRTVSARHRPGRRFSRPTLAAGAAALVALAVMVGVGVTLLPIGNDQQPLVAEGSGGLPVDGGTAAAESADPTEAPTGTPSATTSPASPSPTAKPSPTPVRAKAPTRSVRRTPSPTPTRSKAATGNTGTSSVEQQVVTLVNQERAKAGCGAVTINANLATAAQLHSNDQAARQQMSHTGGDGSDFVQRAKRAGYQYPIGENVAMGYETAAAVMQGWMNSSGHRANILNCDARAIGVGVATGGGRLYWTQVFGSRA